MNKEIKLIPELRFPEFENSGEWEIETLGNLTKVISKRNKENKSLPVYSINNKEGFLPQGEQFEGISSAKRNYDISLYKIIERNTFAYNPARINIGSIGYSGDLHNIIISSLYVCFKTNQKIIDEFLLHFFDTSHFYNEVENNVEGGIRSYLFYQNFSNITIPVPSNLKEQQKIASCLSSLDELIAAHNDKLAALKDHKKGLLQNLFPQEGETVPKVRFPEFENDGEWGVETIDSVSSLVTDYVANGSFQSLRENVNVSNQKGFAYYVRLVDLRAGLGHPNQKFVDQSSYQFLGKSSLHGGELLMANIGANVGEVWQMPMVGYPATLAPNMLMIKCKSQTTSDFVFQFLQSGFGQRNLSLAISGSGHPKINKTDLKQVIVGMPPSGVEQQKIASCLSAVDELISTKQVKIDQLQQHKKGLMQGLFPKI